MKFQTLPVAVLICVVIYTSTGRADEPSSELDMSNADFEEADESELLDRAMRQWTASGDYNVNQGGYQVNAGVNYKKGGWSGGVNGNYNSGGNWKVKAGISYSWGKRRKRSVESPKKPKVTEDNDLGITTLETDIFYVDKSAKTLTDVIRRQNTNEVTYYDYRRSNIVIRSAKDKVCCLHKMTAGMKNMDLAKEEKILAFLQKESAKIPIKAELDDSHIAEFKKSNKAVVEKELGPKIVSLCKGFKMQWMELDGGSENEQQAREFEDEEVDEYGNNDDIEMFERDFDPEELSLERRASCKKVWTCNEVNLASKHKVNATYCCKWSAKSWWVRGKCTEKCNSKIVPSTFRVSCEYKKKC